MRNFSLFCAGLLALAACAPDPNLPSATSTPANPAIPLANVPARLEALWAKIEKAPGFTWNQVITPYFPSEWSPTAGTVWVRYTYAYGRDPQLADAVRVSALCARIELSPSADTAVVVPLASKVEAVGTQGVFPLPGSSQSILAKQDAVTEYALGLRAMPDPALPATADLRAFYREWARANGAILPAFKANHAAFFAWLDS